MAEFTPYIPSGGTKDGFTPFIPNAKTSTPNGSGLLTTNPMPIDFSKLSVKPVFQFNPQLNDQTQSKALLSTIPQQFSQSLEQLKGGASTIANGGTPLQGLQAGLDVGSGLLGMATAPLAPIGGLINAGINKAGDVLNGNNSTVIDDNEPVVKGLNIAAGLGNLAMGILGAKGGEKASIENAKVQAAVDVKTPEPHVNEYAGPVATEKPSTPFTPSKETTPIAGNSVTASFKKPQGLLAAPEQPTMLQNPEQPLLLAAPKGKAPIQGEGFTMSQKADPAKIAQMKAITDYRDAVSKFNQRPTKTSLAAVLKARDLMNKPPETPVPKATAPKVTPSPKVLNAVPIEQKQPLIPKPVTGETPVTESKVVAPNKTGTVTKAASDINETLVKQGFDALPPEEQSKFKSGSYKDDMSATHELMNNDIESAKAMATGEIPAKGIRYPQILFNAIEALATKEGDGALLSKLAASPLGKKLSEAGGTLGSHGFNDNPNSAVKAIQEIQTARRAFAEQRHGDYQKASKKITEQIKTEIKKAAPSKQTWSQFVDDITC